MATVQYAKKQIKSWHALKHVLAKKAEMKRSPDPTKVEKKTSTDTGAVRNEFKQINMDFEAQLQEAKSEPEFARIQAQHKMWLEGRVAQANMESAGMDIKLKGRSVEKNYDKEMVSQFKIQDFKNRIPDNIDEDKAGRWRESIIQTLGYHPWNIEGSNIYHMPVPSATDDVDLSRQYSFNQGKLTLLLSQMLKEKDMIQFRTIFSISQIQMSELRTSMPSMT